MDPSTHRPINSSSAHRQTEMLTFDETIQIAERNVEQDSIVKKDTITKRKFRRLPKLPRLTPAPLRFNNEANVQLPNKDDAVSWMALYDEKHQQNKRLKQKFDDSTCELKCVRATLKATEKILMKTTSVRDHLQTELTNLRSKLTDSEAAIAQQRTKLTNLQSYLADFEAYRGQKQTELADLQSKLDDSEAARIQLQSELIDLQMKVNSLEQHSQKTTPEENYSERRGGAMVHKCSSCDYKTQKANRMKIHREEGCKSVSSVKNCTCEVCGGHFTHNQLRYHLNQYVKKSSHAKNGHQRFTPTQHREMLDKINKAKR